MITRYSRPAMAQIWSEEAKYSSWLEVELKVLQVMEDQNTVPKGSFQAVREQARVDVERILEIEKELKHDVIAFLTSISEKVGDSGRFLHLGMTSNDLLDTALALQMKKAGNLLSAGLVELITAVKARALEFKYLPTIGRSHSIHAEPTTLGLKILSWYTELIRQQHRLKPALKEVAVGKVSGPVGTFSSIDPKVEQAVLLELGISAEPVATQVVSRDRHAHLLSVFSGIGGTIERIATEIRHLQRTEVREIEEPFSPGQKGSSAMPHKKNPILCENLCGLARLLRGYALSAAENVALWHERDISHSSAERVVIPDSFITLDFMIHRLTYVISGMKVNTAHVQKNLDMTNGVIFSSKLLLALVEAGVSREQAYAQVQRLALDAWDNEKNLKEMVTADPEVSRLVDSHHLDEIFDVKSFLNHVDYIFERVG